MPIKIPMGEAQGGDFEPIEPGLYEATIFDIQLKTGRDSGQPYLEFTYKLKENNRRAWDNYSLQPQSLGFLKRLLSRFGYSEEELSGDFEFEPNDLLGKECVVKITRVTEGPYKGSTEVSDVFPPGYTEGTEGRGW